MNKVIICGNLRQDPSVKEGKENSSVRSFSVATSDSVKGGDKKTTWHKVVAFGSLAETCGQYLKKGDSALMEGRIEGSLLGTDKIGR
jgi:single-strand DNA-binding protein